MSRIGNFYNAESLGGLLGSGLNYGYGAAATANTTTPTPPATLQGDVAKLDQHLPPNTNGQPYANDDIANVLRDPKTGEPAHVDGTPLKPGELDTLTALANKTPDQREIFFLKYDAQVRSAAAENAARRDMYKPVFEAVGKNLGAAYTADNRADREREKNEEIVPKKQRQIAARPSN
jgi:hypothetical protein